MSPWRQSQWNALLQGGNPHGGTQEEDRVVIHPSEDEMNHLCWGPMDAGMVENQEEEVQAAVGDHHKANHRVMYPEKLNDIIQVH